ncbi:MAG: TIGR02301 family protein [Robiginitomaculum sp.]|nr:TIGR02301 family protein [Robiginitomaculum sp.]
MKRVLLIIILLLASPVAAQTVVETEVAIKSDPKVTVQQLESRIDKNMVTMTGLVEAMSNNLGQLHFLRALCFGNDDQKWRVTASEMMQIEAPNDPGYRRQLIRAFNAGYYAQKDRYKTCTAAVAMDVAALSENGRHLSTMLGDPYRER